MAKKRSVPSRQHKKVKREVKFFDASKEEIIRTCIILGVIILAVVLFFVLRNALDGHLPVKDGVVVTEQDNWLVYNGGTSNNPRYFKLGTAGDVQGYTRGRDETLVSDKNTAAITYVPVDEQSPIKEATVLVGKGEYTQLATNIKNNLSAYIAGAVVGEIDQSDVNGIPACSLPFEYSRENQPAEDGTPTGMTYVRGAYIYLKGTGEQCAVVQVASEAQTQDALATEEMIKEEAIKVAAQVSIG